MSFRIAFASLDGAYIDQHFGNAQFFQIFDVNGTEYEEVESRRAEASCRGNCDGGFDCLLETLQDCDAIFALKIGQGAAAYMISHGKRIFEASGPVESVLEQVIQANLLEQEEEDDGQVL